MKAQDDKKEEEEEEEEKEEEEETDFDMYFSKTVKAREAEAAAAALAAAAAGTPETGPVSTTVQMQEESSMRKRGTTPKVLHMPTTKIMIPAQTIKENQSGVGAMAITACWLETRRQRQAVHIRLRLKEVLRDLLRAARGCSKLQRFVAAPHETR